jgi:hypothetical protein
MRGHRERSNSLFSYVSIVERIPASTPLRSSMPCTERYLRIEDANV